MACPPSPAIAFSPTEGGGSSHSVDADDGSDKYDDEDDIISATNGPLLTTAHDIEADYFIAEKAAEQNSLRSTAKNS